jgi:hypothetical protein
MPPYCSVTSFSHREISLNVLSAQLLIGISSAVNILFHSASTRAYDDQTCHLPIAFDRRVDKCSLQIPLPASSLSCGFFQPSPALIQYSTSQRFFLEMHGVQVGRNVSPSQQRVSALRRRRRGNLCVLRVLMPSQLCKTSMPAREISGISKSGCGRG